jgi:hypothetical protein
LRAPPVARSSFPQFVIASCKLKKSILLALVFIHAKMDEVLVIHIDNSRDVAFQFGDGACEVGTVPSLLVGAEDAYANYHPSCGGSAVPLA